MGKQILDLTDFRELDAFEAATGLQGSAGVQELRKLFGLLASYGIADWVKFDASIARGLDYYSGVVFEAFALDASLEVRRAICGGGRYNRLLLALDKKDGKKRMSADKDITRPVQFTVVPFTEELMGDAMQIAQRLREAGNTVDVCVDPKVVKKKPNVRAAFEYANGLGATYIAFVAPEELNQGMVTIKQLNAETETQWIVPLAELLDVERLLRCNPPSSELLSECCAVCDGTGKLLRDTCPLCE